ncbi:hypothetical protein ES703_111857 [subsurface metagenome]
MYNRFPGLKRPTVKDIIEYFLKHEEVKDLEDPHEMNKVYSQPAYARVVRELKTELFRLKKELGDTE